VNWLVRKCPTASTTAVSMPRRFSSCWRAHISSGPAIVTAAGRPYGFSIDARWDGGRGHSALRLEVLGDWPEGHKAGRKHRAPNKTTVPSTRTPKVRVSHGSLPTVGDLPPWAANRSLARYGTCSTQIPRHPLKGVGENGRTRAVVPLSRSSSMVYRHRYVVHCQERVSDV